MNEDVAGYMADNIDLLNCKIGLVHSHHALGAFLSGQDKKTLYKEGMDTTCFLSLVVDTKGTYVAALTRKIIEKREITTSYIGSSYEFFDIGSVPINGSTSLPITKKEEVENVRIEYFMLDVEREICDNPYEYLDERFNEITSKKEKTVTAYGGKGAWLFPPKEQKEAPVTPKQATLFPPEEIEDIDTTSYPIDSDDVYTPDPDEVHKAVAQLLTGSLLIQIKDLDLKNWVNKYMEKKYADMFPTPYSFDMYCETMTDFIFNRLVALLWKADDASYVEFEVANAMIEELKKYTQNEYITQYINQLEAYL
jgi:hypothetical protein